MGTWGIPNETGTHAQIDRELCRDYTAEDGTVYSHTDCKLVSFNHHYCIYRVNGVPQAIELHLIQRYRASDARAEEWTYKPLDETMGPVDVDCPLSLLDAVPCPDSDYARQWRERVREYHAAIALSYRVKAGDTVIARGGGKRYEITRLYKRKLVYRAENGREYSLPRQSVGSIEEGNWCP